MPPRYPSLLGLGFRLTLSALLRKRRSFHEDARNSVEKMRPPMKIFGEEHIPQAGPGVITINHYFRPGFKAWWLALGVSAAVPTEIHWVFTAAWRYEDWLKSLTITPATSWAFRNVASVYDFSTMPPMPPIPQDVVQRAIAVRRVLEIAKKTERLLIGLAPEGRDLIENERGVPPPGVGRFLLHLSRLGLPMIPVATFENQDQFCLSFGRSYTFNAPVEGQSREKDRLISQFVMARINALLPEDTHKEFTSQEKQ